MTPLSPSHLLAAAWPFLGMTCESPNGRDPLLQLMFRALGRPTNGSWSPAFVHHVGYWSHFDIGGEWSAWPLPATNDPDDLAKFALVRGIDAPTPARGDVYLRWSPTTERHVRAGIIARVEESFSHPVTGMLCWWCRTIRRQHDRPRGPRRTGHPRRPPAGLGGERGPLHPLAGARRETARFGPRGEWIREGRARCRSARGMSGLASVAGLPAERSRNMLDPGQRDAARRVHTPSRREGPMGLVDSLRTAIAAIRFPVFGPSGEHGRTFRHQVPNIRAVCHKLALRRLGDPDAAEDIAQKVLVKVVEDREKKKPVLDGSCSLEAILRRLVECEIADQYRMDSRRQERDEEFMRRREGSYDSWREADARQREAELDAIYLRARGKLSETQRLVHDLQMGEEELSRREIGERLGMSVGAVRIREDGADLVIRAEYEAAGVTPPPRRRNGRPGDTRSGEEGVQ